MIFPLLETNQTKQDAVVLNLQRACEAVLDLGMHIVRHRKLSIPRSSRETFEILFSAGILSEQLTGNLKRMVGFRNLAVHEYQKLNVNIIKAVVNERLDDFREFVKAIKDA